LGQPRLAGFAEQIVSPAGWYSAHTGTIEWGRRFYGNDSSWERFNFYQHRGPAGAGAAFQSTAPVIADVVSTSRLSRLLDYGVEDCYDFHRYTIVEERSVDVGGGVTAKVVSYVLPEGGDWTTLYWHWPVSSPTGTRYERVVLMMSDTAGASLGAPAPQPALARRLGLGVENTGRPTAGTAPASLAATREFLAGFARHLVANQKAVA
ncbi:MAG: hypothetical protein ACRD0D_07320, partial [Acidimicrobiales bacterium]